MLDTIIANLIEGGEYDEAAETFCKETGTKITFTYTGVEFWEGDYHDTYTARIDRNHKTYRVKFHNSVYDTMKHNRPTKYDLLACLTKWEIGDFEDFCQEYGYTVWSDIIDGGTLKGYNKKSYDLYKAVKKEWENVNRIFGDVLPALCEIV